MHHRRRHGDRAPLRARIELPCFAAFPLVGTDAGRDELRSYYEPHAALARERGIGLVLDTPTWRASAEALAEGGDWIGRIGGVRANASRKSHAELDEAEELDEGDPAELADQYRRLRALLPAATVVGGCCGTDHRHVAAVAEAWLDAS